MNELTGLRREEVWACLFIRLCQVATSIEHTRLNACPVLSVSRCFMHRGVRMWDMFAYIHRWLARERCPPASFGLLYVQLDGHEGMTVAFDQSLKQSLLYKHEAWLRYSSVSNIEMVRPPRVCLVPWMSLCWLLLYFYKRVLMRAWGWMCVSSNVWSFMDVKAMRRFTIYWGLVVVFKYHTLKSDVTKVVFVIGYYPTIRRSIATTGVFVSKVSVGIV
jgi:hypothetical protein